jgi:hypothetical protein
MSVVVLQVFRRGNIAWLWLAILAHALVDFTVAAVPELLGNSLNTSLLLEGIIAVIGAIGIWVIWKLRDYPDAAVVSGEPSPAQSASDPTAPSAE